jgi:hypothetical protein
MKEKNIIFPKYKVFLARLILQIRYFKRTHQFLNLKNPQTFFEKIIWMSLYTDTTLWSKLADKYEVRDYIKKHTNYDILNELYQVYNHVEDININDLPSQFVIKTTNGCATNILVKDSKNISETIIKKQLKKWLHFPYDLFTGQLFYGNIKPRIIAEKYLFEKKNPNKPLTDYKFYCFNGEPKICNVLSNRAFNTHQIDRMICDTNWQILENVIEEGSINYIEKPKSFEIMLEICRDLSKGLPFVRIDLYEIDERPIFGEMTFTPGFVRYSQSFLQELGKMIQIH